MRLWQRTSVEEAVLHCGQGHVCIHTAKRMWPHVAQTTSECGVIVSSVHSHLYLELEIRSDHLRQMLILGLNGALV